MIYLGLAIIIAGTALCFWAASMGPSRTERLRFRAAHEARRGRHRGEKAARQIGGWR